MRRVVLALLLAAATASSAAFAYEDRRPVTAFRLADASAACRYEAERLVCANLVVRSGLALRERGTPRAVDAIVWWDASTPVVGRWSHDGLCCRITRSAILCRNRTGAAISVSARQIAVLL
jgi:hypothetical protein